MKLDRTLFIYETRPELCLYMKLDQTLFIYETRPKPCLYMKLDRNPVYI